MRKSPELILGYEQDAVPRSAVCSVCGQQMPDPPPGPQSAMECYIWYTAQFEEHLSLCHLHPSNPTPNESPKRPSAVALVV